MSSRADVSRPSRPVGSPVACRPSAVERSRSAPLLCSGLQAAALRVTPRLLRWSCRLEAPDLALLRCRSRKPAGPRDQSCRPGPDCNLTGQIQVAPLAAKPEVGCCHRSRSSRGHRCGCTSPEQADCAASDCRWPRSHAPGRQREHCSFADGLECLHGIARRPQGCCHRLVSRSRLSQLAPAIEASSLPSCCFWLNNRASRPLITT
ncbi:MAG: Uncharacterised protein [Synechococcus sp. MIT S9220]|nr:MAG: Uncharacterised protein [Synechococcus sp. MIT S9220]